VVIGANLLPLPPARIIPFTPSRVLEFHCRAQINGKCLKSLVKTLGIEGTGSSSLDQVIRKNGGI
jgi:hypothetical protein